MVTLAGSVSVSARSTTPTVIDDVEMEEVFVRGFRPGRGRAF
jgi:hypothetical protein